MESGPSQPNNEPLNKADEKAREAREADIADSFDRWDAQMIGADYEARVDDYLGTRSEEQHEGKRVQAAIAAIEAGYAESAETEQEQSESKAKAALSDVMEQMPAQQADLARQIESENPAELVSERAISQLLQNVKEGRVGQYMLMDTSIHPAVQREAIADLFAKLDQEDPLPTLDRIEKGLFGRDKHVSTEVAIRVEVAGKEAEVVAHRIWSSNHKEYYYLLGGGLPATHEAMPSN